MTSLGRLCLCNWCFVDALCPKDFINTWTTKKQLCPGVYWYRVPQNVLRASQRRPASMFYLGRYKFISTLYALRHLTSLKSLKNVLRTSMGVFLIGLGWIPIRYFHQDWYWSIWDVRYSRKTSNISTSTGNYICITWNTSNFNFKNLGQLEILLIKFFLHIIVTEKNQVTYCFTDLIFCYVTNRKLNNSPIKY